MSGVEPLQPNYELGTLTDYATRENFAFGNTSFSLLMKVERVV